MSNCIINDKTLVYYQDLFVYDDSYKKAKNMCTVDGRV